jgi:hypothetical protein
MSKTAKSPARQNIVRGNVDGILIQDSQGDIHITQNAQSGADEIDALFTTLRAYLSERKPGPEQAANEEVETVLATLESEAAKGETADTSKLERWMKILAGMAPDIMDVILASFNGPLSGFGMVFKKIAERSHSPVA